MASCSLARSEGEDQSRLHPTAQAEGLELLVEGTADERRAIAADEDEPKCAMSAPRCLLVE